MISAITGGHAAAANDAAADDADEALVAPSPDRGDSGSSSLSDIDAASDDDEEELGQLDVDVATTLRSRLDDAEIDSEAETERLERTPRKLDHVAAAGKQPTETSPSKLSQVVSKPDVAAEESSQAVDSETPTTSTIRKRKRSEYEDKTLTDNPLDAPSPKRSHSSKDRLDDDLTKDQMLSDADETKLDAPDVVEEPSVPPEEIEEVEQPIPVRGRPGRRGKRRGRRAAPLPPLPPPPPPPAALLTEDTENPAEASVAPVQEAEAEAEVEAEAEPEAEPEIDVEAEAEAEAEPEVEVEEQPELEQEEEDEASPDEERKFHYPPYTILSFANLSPAVARRKEAAEALSRIEKEFNAFRLKYVDVLSILNFDMR
jgi:hypothetical protein